MTMKRIGDRVLEKLGEGTYYPTEKGFSADCPICEEEEPNKGRKKLLITSDGRIICYRFRGDSDMHWNHIKDLCEHLGINLSDNSYHSKVGDYSIRMDREATKGGKHVIEVTGPEGRIALDKINPIDQKDRRRFISTLRLPNESVEIERTLQELASRVLRQKHQDTPQIDQSGFLRLEDGRLAEQTMSGFAVYDPVLRETETKRTLTSQGVTYTPWTSGISLGDRGGVLLPDNIVEYYDEKVLAKSIEDYMTKYVDVPAFECQLVSAYLRFTYLYDKTWELPYLRITGESGSGKSRLTQIVGMACYRPLLVVNPSAASIYRVIEKFQPTLVIDEANMQSQSEDTEALFQILNAGYQKINSVPRCEKGKDDGEMEVKLFSPYGPKIITGLSTTDSRAFESRCIQIEMRRTNRSDVPFQITQEMIDDAARIRGMLTLWRMRNWHLDMDTALAESERELKAFDILPRFIQIAIPLYSVIQDEQLRKSFAQMLVERTKTDTEDKRGSFEGVLVSILWDRLFDDINGKIVGKNWPLCLEYEPCELLVVEDITKDYNRRLGADTPKSMLNPVQIGKRLKQKLQLNTSTINSRKSDNRKKSAVVFDTKRLQYLFQSYGYQMPERDESTDNRPTEPENPDFALG